MNGPPNSKRKDSIQNATRLLCTTGESTFVLVPLSCDGQVACG